MGMAFKTGPNRGLVRAKVVRDAVMARIAEVYPPDQRTNGPREAARDLGMIPTPDGPRRAIVRHAVDLVVLLEGIVGDDLRIPLITRGNPPGEDRLALPGGFIDLGETAADAALREAEEEIAFLTALGTESKTKKSAQRSRNSQAKGPTPHAIPPWRYLRRFDIRVTDWLPAPVDLGGGVVMQPGDLMAVTTQPFVVRVGGLAVDQLTAGDDARALTLVPVADLDPNAFGVKDHYAIIEDALAMAASVSASAQ